MKIQILLFLAVFTIPIQIMNAQIYPSTCESNEELIERYKNDADQLTVRQFYYLDSVEIPEQYRKIYLDALIAVYNTEGLEVLNEINNIHTYPYPDLNRFQVYTQNTMGGWVGNLVEGVFPTGYPAVDDFLDKYSLSLEQVIPNINFTMRSPYNYNMRAMAKQFEDISGYKTYEVGFIGDGDDIIGQIFPDYVQLTYFVGWGSCPSGCIWGHYWEFKVYLTDCLVEFVGEYGDDLTSIIRNSNEDAPIKIFQTNSSLKLTQISFPYEYVIYDRVGNKVLWARNNFSDEIAIKQLCTGVYFIRIENKGKIQTIPVFLE